MTEHMAKEHPQYEFCRWCRDFVAKPHEHKQKATAAVDPPTAAAAAAKPCRACKREAGTLHKLELFYCGTKALVTLELCMGCLRRLSSPVMLNDSAVCDRCHTAKGYYSIMAHVRVKEAGVAADPELFTEDHGVLTMEAVWCKSCVEDNV